MKLNKTGFSLLEATIAIAIFALMSMMIFFNRSLLDYIAVKTELDLLYTRCCFLQRCAMAQGAKQEMIFDPSAHCYTYQNNRHALPANVRFGIVVGTKGPPASPTTIIRSPITFDQNRLTFSADGIASAGAIYLIDAQGNYSYALTSPVAQSSHMRKYSYRGHWTVLS